MAFRTLFLLASGLFCAVTCHTQGIPERLDQYVQTRARRSHFSGAVLVARDGRVLLSEGFGMANAEQDAPNTIQTKFRIASLTKQFTAVAILILQERGALNVQDSICRYLPKCPIGWEQITIHHLLTHTSGLADASYFEKLELLATADSAIEYLTERSLRFAPGARFSYGGSNYVLLGYIIESASGQPYEKFLYENIFRPLDLKDTGYDRQARILKHRAAGYSLRGETLMNAAHVDMSVPFAAGGLYSTVGDLYRWVQALSTGKLVSAKSLAVMWTPFQGGYGYGWYISRNLDHRFISHGGWINGFAAAIGHLPNERITAIVLSNVDSSPVNTMARDLAVITLGAGIEISPGHKASRVNPAIYDDYAGRYELPSGILIIVTRERNKLIGRATGYPSVELLPESETTFFVKELGARITFVRDGRQATHLILYWDKQEFKARKIQDRSISNDGVRVAAPAKELQTKKR